MFDFKEAKKNEEAIKRGGIYIVKDELSVMLTARFFLSYEKIVKSRHSRRGTTLIFFFFGECVQ